MAIFLATWERPGRVAIEAAWRKHSQGGSILDSVEYGLATAEFDPSLVAIGLGSVPNTDGEMELDASVMEGKTLNAGAVCSVRGIVPAISVARMVMEKTPHVMLSGEQARRFAITNGFRPRNLITGKAAEVYDEWRRDPEEVEKYVHSIEDFGHDTITMIGFDGESFIAASSTSGLPFKMPGRVGDSPIIGAGIYADDEVGAAGATGNGEELWKACVSIRVIELMRSGQSPQEACEAVVNQMVRRSPAAGEYPSVVFAMNRKGEHGAAVSFDQFQLWRADESGITMQRFSPTWQS